METVESLIEQLQQLGSAPGKKAIERYGIPSDNALGIKIPLLRLLAKQVGKNHSLALQLWKFNIHEAKILASMLADPLAMSPAELDAWVADFYSWDVCDQCCINTFIYTRYWKSKIRPWMEADHEFTRRAGIVLIAVAPLHQAKSTTNDELILWLRESLLVSTGSRNFVKKAISWALRQCAKKRPVLLTEITSMAETLAASDHQTQRWIGKDVLRELTSQS